MTPQIWKRLKEMAKAYAGVGKVPERVNWNRAQEIALLAQAFLMLNEKYKKDSE